MIFATVIFMVIALSLIQVASSEMDKTDSGNLGQARAMGESVAETINTVYVNGPGYSANITLQNLTNSANYTVYVYNTGNISVIYHSNNITIKLIPTNIKSFSMKNNGTTYKIINSNGTIQLV